MTIALEPARSGSGRRGWRLWEGEAAGAFADLGVMVPIAIALIVRNGLSPTAVLLPAGLTYLMVARVYRLPVAVQPLKAFGAIAIAAGAGADVIAAGALLMGAVFLLLGASRILNRVAAWFPLVVIRGVQLAVVLTFIKIAWGLIANPPQSFTHQLSPVWVGGLALVITALLLLVRRGLILIAVLIGFGVAIALGSTGAGPGPSPIEWPSLDLATFATAAVLLVIPQVPLSFANSCLAPADAARTYFGEAAARVTPNRLAATMGVANVFAGSISGMPVCHGAGGMSAHYTFGARTWRAPLVIGTLLVIAALAFGEAFVGILSAFPLPLLAALLLVAAAAHIALLKDLRGAHSWTLALAIGVVGISTNLAWAVVGGLAVEMIVRWRGRSRSAPRSKTQSNEPSSIKAPTD